MAKTWDRMWHHQKISGLRLVLAILGAFCLSDPAIAEWSRKVGAEIDLGENLVGETCRAVLERHDDDYDFAKHRIYCGAWAEPSGTVNSWTFRRNRTNAAWRDRRKYWWRPDMDRHHLCTAGEDSEILDDVHIATLDCVTREGGFPYAAYVGKIGKRIFFVDYIPANANVAATLSGIVSDRIDASERAQGSASRVVTGLTSRAENDPNLLYGANDYAGYKDNFELGRLLNHAKEHAAAVAAFRRALGYQQRLLGKDHSATGGTIARIGNDLRNQGLFEEAHLHFDRAEDLLAPSPHKNDLAELMVYRAYDTVRREAHDEAISFAEQAIRMRREYWEDDNAWVAHAIYAKAWALFKAGRISAARQQAEDSLRLYEGALGRVHHWPANLELLLASIEAEDDDIDDALDHATRAIELRERLFGRGIAFAEALWRRAEIHTRAGDEPAANQDFTTAIDALSALGLEDRLSRDSVDPDRLAEAVRARVGGADGTPLDTALSETILSAMQLPRRGVSKRTVSRMAARAAAATPELAKLTRELQDVKLRRDDLRYDLARRMGREEKRRSPEREAQIAGEIETLNARVRAISGALQSGYPDYARMVDPVPLTRSTLSELLRPGEAVVRFVLGENGGSTVLVRNGQVFGHQIEPTRPEIARTVARLRTGVEAGAGEPFDMRASHQLFTDLFGPLGARLQGIRHLFVVPDGPLSSLPPALFVTAEPPRGREEYASARWLGRDMAISILPTISALREVRITAGTSSGTEAFLGIADPRYDAHVPAARDARDPCPVEIEPFDPAALARLAPLPETRIEIEGIESAVAPNGGTLLSGETASESGLLATDPSRYRGIAFATHGLLPSEIECGREPGLALTPGGSESPTLSNDGFLAASEIAQLRLDADWVLLSACNTGTINGKLRGESLSALTGAFIYAGSRRVIASHWAIASEPTVRLTTTALSDMQTLGPAEGMRRAITAFLETPDLSHPVFWAPFTIYGDGAAR